MPGLHTLMDRIAGQQRDVMERIAATDMLPSQGEIRRIAKLENAFAAVAALIEERGAAAQP